MYNNMLYVHIYIYTCIVCICANATLTATLLLLLEGEGHCAWHYYNTISVNFEALPANIHKCELYQEVMYELIAYYNIVKIYWLYVCM